MRSMKRTAAFILMTALALNSVAVSAAEFGARAETTSPSAAMPASVPAVPLQGLKGDLDLAPAVGLDAALAQPASAIAQPLSAEAASQGESQAASAAGATDEAAAMAGYEKGTQDFDLAGENRKLPVATPGAGAGAPAGSAAGGGKQGDGFPDTAAILQAPRIILPGTRFVFSFPGESQGAKQILAAKDGADNGYVFLTVAGKKQGEQHHMGTLARVISTQKKDDDTLEFTIEGVRELKVISLIANIGRAEVKYRLLPLGDSDQIAKYKSELRGLLRRLNYKPEFIANLLKMDQAAMINTVVHNAIGYEDLSLDVQKELLAANSLEDRLRILMGDLRDAAAEQEDEQDPEAKEIREKIEESGMPENVRKVADDELKNFREQRGTEREATKNYLTWLTGVPWSARTDDNLDLKLAEEYISLSHTGLQSVKDRIIEFLAVRKATGIKKGAILAFVGPPGTGKTSLAKAIAHAMGRKFVRKSLGGKKDISELVGHGRTYVKSRPGAIIRKMKEAGVKNPVFLLDEGEKASDDLMAGMLEILDKEQNDTFEDTFMEVPYDLSEVLFIVTINDLDKVSGPMRDRMEIIDFTSYTLKEKIRIAKNHILAEQRAEVGLKPDQAQLDDEALKFIIEGYTRESGVRNVQKMINKLFRKELTRAMKAGEVPKARLTIDDIRKPEYLGNPKYENRKPWDNQPGDAWGLGVNATGGSLLNIQARMRPGKGELTLRQQMLEMIRDSAENVMQVVYAQLEDQAKKHDIDPKILEEKKFSLSFVPAGKVDGPSAGITMTTAMMSLLTGRLVRPDVTMTGEIDMGGRVHAIGGLKEKILASYASGKKTVLFPQENLSDIDDLDPEIRKDMTLIPVTTIDQVLALALEPAPAKAAEAAK